MTASLRRFRVGSLSIAAAGEPPAPALLLLHGIGSSGDAFAGQLADFGDTRWCLAPDAPGYAQSDDDPSIASMADYVSRFVGLLDALSIDRTDLLGVSWGGVIAVALALRHPDRVRTLILSDTSRGSGRSADQAEAMRRRPDALISEGAARLGRSRAPRLLAPNAPASLVDRVGEMMASSIRMPGYGQAADSMAETDHTAALERISAPTLVIVGAHDAVCPPAESELIASLIPGAELAVIDNAGHLPNQEQPDDFNQVVDTFLRRKETT